MTDRTEQLLLWIKHHLLSAETPERRKLDLLIANMASRQLGFNVPASAIEPALLAMWTMAEMKTTTEVCDELANLLRAGDQP